jgi:hypothetical protein
MKKHIKTFESFSQSRLDESWFGWKKSRQQEPEKPSSAYLWYLKRLDSPTKEDFLKVDISQYSEDEILDAFKDAWYAGKVEGTRENLLELLETEPYSNLTGFVQGANDFVENYFREVKADWERMPKMRSSGSRSQSLDTSGGYSSSGISRFSGSF